MKNINKPICSGCINSGICKGECPPIQWINGTKSRREPLVNDILSENLNNEKNYNEIISELAEDRRQRMIEILAISNPRKKAIMLLLLAGYNRCEIARYFKISIRQVYNIVHKKASV